MTLETLEKSHYLHNYKTELGITPLLTGSIGPSTVQYDRLFLLPSNSALDVRPSLPDVPAVSVLDFVVPSIPSSRPSLHPSVHDYIHVSV